MCHRVIIVPRRMLAVCMVAMVLLPLPGCSAGSEEGPPETARRLQTLARMFNRYAAHPKHRGKAPPNEAALKAFIQNDIPAAERKAMNIENVDELFASPRDKRPFVVNYGKDAANPLMAPGAGVQAKGAARPVLAYEHTGEGGKRWVVYGPGETEEVDIDRAQQLGLR